MQQNEISLRKRKKDRLLAQPAGLVDCLILRDLVQTFASICGCKQEDVLLGLIHTISSVSVVPSCGWWGKLSRGHAVWPGHPLQWREGRTAQAKVLVCSKS